jgi:nucleoside-diphosphate-sugar epimerase
VYAASKTEAEQAVWQFVKDRKPNFVANSILPNTNYGTILANGEAVTTAKWVKSLYDGDVEHVKDIPPRKSHFHVHLTSLAESKSTEWFVDVQDCARLHVACLINPDVQNERIFAFAEPFNFE